MGGQGEHFRVLHTMIRVLDLDRSLDFYVNKLGMDLQRRMEFESGRFTLAFVGYGNEQSGASVELTHNWDRTEPYNVGDGFGHIAVGVRDIFGLCKHLEKQGVAIPRPPAPMKHGTTVIAFLEDPDGYKIELIQYG